MLEPAFLTTKSETAYPYPDREARRVMHAAKRKNTNALLLAFWTEVFRIAAEYIAEFSPGTIFTDETELAVAWRCYLEENDRAIRRQLYARAKQASRCFWRFGGHVAHFA